MAKPDQPRSARTRWRSTGGRALLLALGLASAGVAAALLGGGEIGGGDPEPAPATGAPRQIAATIMEFPRARADGDFATICGNLFTTEAREAAGGDRCPSVLQDTAGGLRDPEVRIVRINVRGQTAIVTVRARVAGGESVTDTIRLVRQGGRYKIVSAGQEAVGEE